MTFEETTAFAAAPAPTDTPADGLVLTIVQHDEDVPLDQFATWLADAGIAELRTIRAWAGEPIPADPEAVGDGLIVLGGHANALADDVAPWLPATRALLAACVAAGTPTLGICLGAQLLAVACGGRLQVAAPPGREAGIARIHWRPEAVGDPVVGTLVGQERTRSTLAPSMHADAVVDLPPRAAWLGSSDMYPYQAFRIGSAWGVQFHPEASALTLGAWAAQYDGVDEAAVAAAFAAAEPELAAAGRALAQNFAATAMRAAETRRV